MALKGNMYYPFNYKQVLTPARLKTCIGSVSTPVSRNRHQ